MIDLHCHILPELDDGAKDWDETLKMIEIAKNNGITDLIATPHIYPEFYFPEMDKIKEKFEELKSKSKDINFYLGNDLHLTPETIKYLKEGKALTLNNGRYVLIEPPEFFSENELENLLFSLRCEGYIPIITHPERYQIFREKIKLLQRIKEQGNLLQITSASITGYFGETVQEFCKELFKQRLINFIASDAHSPRRRVPFLKEAYDKVEDWTNSEYVLYLQECAKKVLHNEDINEFKIKEKRRNLLKELLQKIWLL